MDKIHPLTEIVARRLEQCGQNATYAQLAQEAIRAVLTFEPTESVISAGFIVHPCASGVSNAYRAMTAALLKEVEND